MASPKNLSFYLSPVVWAIAGIAVVLGVGVIMLTRVSPLDDANVVATTDIGEQTIEIGGVRRPRSDVGGLFPSVEDEERASSTKTVRYDSSKRFEKGYPKNATPLLSPDENPSVRQVHDALLAGGKKAEQAVSLFAGIAPFDAEVYFQDPDAYLSVVEPARIWQSAQPSKDVPQLKRVSERNHKIAQGESVRLQVRTQPNAPVSFFSFDMGAFQNRLAMITVAADDTGIASADFNGTPGTTKSVNILASSPLASGNLEFRVFVEPASFSR
jgi:hypothetical protein